MTDFALISVKPRLPAPCMAYDEERSARCLVDGSNLYVSPDERYAPACDKHADWEEVRVDWRDPVLRTDGEMTAHLEKMAEIVSELTPPEPRPSWDEYFDGLALAAAARADCTRRKVAALLISPRHHVVATGYNGAPKGVPGCLSAGACPRGRASFSQVPSRSNYASGEGACIANHAERNAVEQFIELMDSLEVPRARAMAFLATCRMVVTCEPCPQCYALLGAVGITDVRWPAGTD